MSARSGISVPSVYLDDMSEKVFRKALIHHGNEEHAVVYRIDVLQYHLSLQKIPGTTRSKFNHMLMVMRVVLCIIHSNAEEESVFSHAKKNLTPQRASLELDRNLLRILSF